ncbi:MAG: c-type cytochrome, partial [Pseudohongiellaceae bacterium]
MSSRNKLIGVIVAIALSHTSFFPLAQAQNVGLGTPISESQLADFDLIAGPDGNGLPVGSGTALQGKEVFEAQCAVCHALNGEGTSGNTVLVGG